MSPRDILKTLKERKLVLECGDDMLMTNANGNLKEYQEVCEQIKEIERILNDNG